MSTIPIAFQMYTVREEAGRDFEGTLRKVSESGYKGVALAGTYGHSAPYVRGLVTDLNMEIAGSHVPLDQLENNLEAVMEYNIELTNRSIVCPLVPEERRKSADDYRRLGDI